VKHLQVEADSCAREADRARREAAEQEAGRRELEARVSAQERELGEMAVRVSRQEEVERAQRELMVA
jgi:hypothetical protein